MVAHRFEASARRVLHRRRCVGALRGALKSIAGPAASRCAGGFGRGIGLRPMPGTSGALGVVLGATPSSSWAVRPLAASARAEVVHRALCNERRVGETAARGQRVKRGWLVVSKKQCTLRESQSHSVRALSNPSIERTRLRRAAHVKR